MSNDGQALAQDDVLGLSPAPPPMFVKRFAEVGAAVSSAVASYVRDVRVQVFPSDEHVHSRRVEAAGERADVQVAGGDTV